MATMSAARKSVSSAIAAVLPAGATFEVDDLADWSGALGSGGKGLPIRLRDEGRDFVALTAPSPNNVASGSEEQSARLVWRMTETVPVTDVAAVQETRVV